MESGNFGNWTIAGKEGGFSDKTLMPACRDDTPSGPCASVDFGSRLCKVGAKKCERGHEG